MRVVLVPAGGGHYAIVQIAQGGAEDPKPQFVPAEVKGKNVSFSVGEEKFTGTATAAGLTLKNAAVTLTQSMYDLLQVEKSKVARGSCA